MDTLRVVELERLAILKALAKTNGNVEQAAVLVDLGRTTLYRKINRYVREAQARKVLPLRNVDLPAGPGAALAEAIFWHILTS
jgi:hypothetical protein